MEAVNGDSDKGAPPPPSPLTGCYLLIVIGEPHCNEHKDIILQRVAKGLLSWDVNDCLVDLEKELAIITEQALEGEEARYGERLIQFASENLVTEILIHPVVSTLAQCVRNLLSSFTRHRHIIHAGYTFANNGSWVLQDGTFSLADFSEAFQEIEVLRVIRAYENGISLDLHCAPEGDWTRLPKEPFTKSCKVRVNPNDVLTAGSPSISSFINYLEPFLISAELENILESSDVVGNIRFSRPTLYVFPGGQGDAALFGINGFNMLLDGGFSRKACFWDFVRHLDRLDAVLLTRLNNSNVNGISAVLRRKRQNAVYPQIGHFFCNIQERKAILSPDGDKDKDPLLINLLDEGQEIVTNLRHLGLTPQVCYRDSEPINLYHKVGHGTLDMYVLSPAKDSKEVREFLQKWNNNDQKLFANQKTNKDFVFPLQNLVSICALLVWQPANPEDTITRILFPGSSSQNKIFEGLDKIKSLEFIKHPVCSEKSLAPTSIIKTKQTMLEKIIQNEKPEKKIIDNKKEKPTKPPADNIEAELKNGEVNGVQPEKIAPVKKSDSTESEKSISKPKKIIENGEKIEKPKPKPKFEVKTKPRSDSQQRKIRSAEKKPSPTTPKKSVEKMNGEPKPKPKASPSATPAKSTKEANNRKVVESKIKTAAPRKEPPKPAEKKEIKTDRKPISRRPKDISKLSGSPSKKVNGVTKPDTIAKRGKLDKEGTTDSSTVSTPSADQDSILKKDISKLTTDEIQNLKAQELADLKEEQEAVKEIEAVFRKGEHHEDKPSDFRKIKDLSMEDKLENEEYLIIEKTEIEQDLVDETNKEEETQKIARDSEESEKQRKLSGEIPSKEADLEDKRTEIEDEVQKIITSATDIVKAKDEVVDASKEVSATSPEDKIDLSTDKKDNENEIKEIAQESQPDEKGSANIESGATTTAPTLPEDERMPLDEIKEDNGDQIIEEKHVKEDTKEKDVPVIQLPPKAFENIAKLPPVVGIRLDKQSHIRDIVKTPDEVADLPVHEEVDIDHYDEYPTSTETKTEPEELKNEEKIEIKEEKVVPTEDKVEDKTKTEPEITKEKKLVTEEKLTEKDEKVVISEDLNKKELSKSPDEEKDTDEHELEMKKEEVKETKITPPTKPTEPEAIKFEETTAKPLEKVDEAKKPEETKAVIKTEAVKKSEETKPEEVKKEEVPKVEVNELEIKIDEIKEEITDNLKNDLPTPDSEKKEVVEKSEIEVKEKDDLKDKEKKVIENDLSDELPGVPKEEIVIKKDDEKPKEPVDEKIKLVKKDVSTIQKIEEKLQKLKEVEEVKEVKGVTLPETKKSTEEIIQPDKDQVKMVKEEVTAIKKIDEKLQKLKEMEEEQVKAVSEIITHKTEEPQHAEPVIITTDSLPESPGTDEKKIEDIIDLGSKSPKEREEDVAKIVASVAEVLKSDAPLEEFEGKIPFAVPYKTYTTELRETHITTVDSPVTDEARSIKDAEEVVCPKTSSTYFIEEERKIAPIHEEQETQETKISKMIKDSNELMQATSRMIQDIKLGPKIDDVIEEEDLKEDQDAEAGTVHRMLVTASSEDGGEETEICPPGTITFSRSSESSGRSSPDLQSQKLSQKSSIADTVSDATVITKSIAKELESAKILDDSKEPLEETKMEKEDTKDTKPVIKKPVCDSEKPTQEKAEDLSQGIKDLQVELDEGKDIAKDEMTKEDIKDVKTVEEKLANMKETSIKDISRAEDTESVIKEDAKKIDEAIKDVQETVETVKADADKPKAKDIDKDVTEEKMIPPVDIIISKDEEENKEIDEVTKEVTKEKDSTEDGVKEGKEVIESEVSTETMRESTKDAIKETVEGVEAKDVHGITMEIKEAASGVKESLEKTKKEVKTLEDKNKIEEEKKEVTEDKCDVLEKPEESEEEIKETIDDAKEKLEESAKEVHEGKDDIKEVPEKPAKQIKEAKDGVNEKPDEPVKEIKDDSKEKLEESAKKVKEAKDDFKEKSKEPANKVFKDDVKQTADEPAKEAKDDLKGKPIEPAKQIEEVKDDVIEKADESVKEIKEQEEPTTRIEKVEDDVKGEPKEPVKEIEEAKDDDKGKPERSTKEIEVKDDVMEKLDKPVKDLKEDVPQEIKEDIVKETKDVVFAKDMKLDTKEGAAEDITGALKEVKVDKPTEKVEEDIAKDLTNDKAKEVKSLVDDIIEVETLTEKDDKVTKIPEDKDKDSKEVVEELIVKETAQKKESAKEKVEDVKDDVTKLSEGKAEDKATDVSIQDKAECIKEATTVLDDTKEFKETLIKETEATIVGAKEKIKDAKKDVETKVEEVYEDVAEKSASLGGIVRDIGQSLLKDIGHVIDSTRKEVQEIEDLAESKIEEIKEDMSVKKEAVFDAVEDFKKLLAEETEKETKDHKAKIVDAAEGFQEAVVKDSSKIVEKAKEEAKDTKELIESKIEDVKESLAEQKATYIGVVEDVEKSISKDIATAIEEAKKQITDAKETTTGQVEEVSKAAVEKVDDFKKEMEAGKVTTKEIMDDSKQLLEETKEKIVEQTTAELKDIESKTDSILQDLKTTEQELKKGLVEETKALEGEFSEKKEEVAERLEQITKDVSQMGSELKETITGISEVPFIKKDAVQETSAKPDERDKEETKYALHNGLETVEKMVVDVLTADREDPIDPKAATQKGQQEEQKLSSTIGKAEEDLEKIVEKGVTEVKEIVEETKEAITSIFKGTGSHKEQEEVLEKTAHDIEENYNVVSDMAKSMVFEKCDKTTEEDRKNEEKSLEESAKSIEKNFDTVTNMTKSVVFAKCSRPSFDTATEEQKFHKTDRDIEENYKTVSEMAQSIVFEKCEKSEAEDDKHDKAKGGELQKTEETKEAKKGEPTAIQEEAVKETTVELKDAPKEKAESGTEVVEGVKDTVISAITKESIKDDQDQKKDSPDKPSGKASPEKLEDVACKLSGKSSPALSDDLKDLLKESSGKSTPEVKDSSHIKVDNQDSLLSGKSSPGLSGKSSPILSGSLSPGAKAESKDSLLSGKSSPMLSTEAKEFKESLSGKSSPEPTKVDSKDTVSPSKASDNKAEEKTDIRIVSEKSFPAISGKSSPILTSDIKSTEDLISGKSTPVLKDKQISDKDVKEAKVSEVQGHITETKVEKEDIIAKDEKDTKKKDVDEKKVEEVDKHSTTVSLESIVKEEAIKSIAEEKIAKDEKKTEHIVTEDSKAVPLKDSKDDTKTEKLPPDEPLFRKEDATIDIQVASKEKTEPAKDKTEPEALSKTPLDTNEPREKKLSISDVKISVKVPEEKLSEKISIEPKIESPEDTKLDEKIETKELDSIDSGIGAEVDSKVRKPDEPEKEEVKVSETKEESIAGPSTTSLSPVKSLTEDLHLSGKSTPDIADVEKMIEIQETLKHEKHIPGSSTPPTVPVSPIIKEISTAQPEEVKSSTPTKAAAATSIKDSDLRSCTPASDDYEIGASTYSDISSGQVSRAPHLLESERIESDEDDDVPGSPMSVTSQVAHSRSSSRYDFEDERIGPKMDPMSTSFYGALPDEAETELEFEKAMVEHRQTRGEDLVTSAEDSSSYLYEITKAKFSTPEPDLIGQAQLDQINKNGSSGLMTASFVGDLPTTTTETKKDPFDAWGKPLGLPSPAPPNDNRGTPKKERKLPSNVSAKNKLNDDKKRAESPSKYKNKKISPVYVDLTYVPHHGNSYYSYVDFFKRVRARYYVFSGIEPSREVYNALLEAKQTWEDKELEVTIIPTYDTDILGYWVAENEELLTKYKIDLSPSASRCTINLQDHETSCSAYRLEF